MHIFEITDKSNRKIRLTKERWNHIKHEHPNVTDIEELKATLTKPVKILPSTNDPDVVKYYYKYDKEKRRYLMIAVKYLNGNGYIITSFYRPNIQ